MQYAEYAEKSIHIMLMINGGFVFAQTSIVPKFKFNTSNNTYIDNIPCKFQLIRSI
jgi:hypothetical protein